MTLDRLRQPRCILVYALAPAGMSPADANHVFNDYILDPALPLVLFHDHFIGRPPGGIAIFFTETPEERQALLNSTALQGWEVTLRPLIFSRSPAAFDEQIAFTLRAYRGQDWEVLQKQNRPTYGNPTREAETGEEDS